MAIFTASFTVAQSADCTTLTFTDTSNYLDNTSGINLASFGVRQFVVKDSNYQIVDTIVIEGDSLSGIETLTQDEWQSVELQLFLVGNVTETPDYTATHSVLSTCFLELCYSTLVADTESGCACGCSGGSCNCNNTQSNKILLLEFIKAAQIFSQYSNPVLAQKQLDAGTAVCNANENNN